MEQKTSPSAYISPCDKEKMEAIIWATCLYYQISEEELKYADKSMEATAVRRQCFFLILTNTSVKDKFIANRLATNRSSVALARGIIETHRTIYQQTRNSLKGIVVLANTFEKTIEWHIQ